MGIWNYILLHDIIVFTLFMCIFQDFSRFSRTGMCCKYGFGGGGGGGAEIMPKILNSNFICTI